MFSKTEFGSEEGTTIIAGAGVVGRAIARAFLDHSQSIVLLDIDAANLVKCCELLSQQIFISHTQVSSFASGGFWTRLSPKHGSASFTESGSGFSQHGVVIESIVEKLDAKRSFFEQITAALGPHYCIATNTSTLRLSDMSTACKYPEKFCGLHFFKPVRGRDHVEVVRTPQTSSATLTTIQRLAESIGKDVLRVNDHPTLVVNRLLTPYLNQGLALLGFGADHQAIRDASHMLGMPRSPLEMIDMIGARTAFDAGRAAWQAFPERVEPSPILPGLVKQGLLGWSTGKGFYEYAQAVELPSPSKDLNESARNIISKYQRNTRVWNLEEIYKCFLIPMWIEAACLLREQVTEGWSAIELAMRHGLGMQDKRTFLQQIEALGSEKILQSLFEYCDTMKAMNAPSNLRHYLAAEESVYKATQNFVTAIE